MSLLFGTPKNVPGCAYKRRINGGYSGAKFGFIDYAPQFAVVQNFNISQADDYAPVKCLGDVAYLNVFGRAPVAQMTVTLLLFLYAGTRGDTGILSMAKKAFLQKRLSTVVGGGTGTDEPCALTVGTYKLATCYPVSLHLRASSDPVGIAYADVEGVTLNYR